MTLQRRNGRTEVHDSETPLVAGNGCRREQSGAVSCDPERVDVWVVDLGDGDDALTVNAAFGNAWYFGGDGNDRISGGGGHEAYSGGAGADELRGRLGTDVFDEDGVRHSPEVDLYDGGPGMDHVSYAAPTRTTGITVDLTAGFGPEGDRLVAVESMHGTDHDDLLIGSEQDGTIYAQGGSDRIDARGGDDSVWTDLGAPGSVEGDDIVSGGGGDDELTSGGGSDRVSGGAGDDLLIAERQARVRCGPGLDRRSADPARVLRLAADCELLAAGTVALSARPRRLGGDRLAFRAYCSRQRCRAALELRAHGNGRRGRLLVRARRMRLHPQRGGTFVVPRPTRRRVVALLDVSGSATFQLLLPSL